MNDYFKQWKHFICTWFQHTWKKFVPLIRQPFFWVMLLAIAVCLWAAGSTIKGRLSSAPANPMDGSVTDNSNVMLKQVAQLAAADMENEQSPEEEALQVYDEKPFVPSVTYAPQVSPTTAPGRPSSDKTTISATKVSGSLLTQSSGLQSPGNKPVTQRPSSENNPLVETQPSGATPNKPAPPVSPNKPAVSANPGNPVIIATPAPPIIPTKAPGNPASQVTKAPENPAPAVTSSPQNPAPAVTQAPENPAPEVTAVPVPDNLPQIYTDLADNTHVEGNYLAVSIAPIDRLTNSRIPSTSISVFCNSFPVNCLFDTQTASCYNLPLAAGTNTIIIRATDSGGRTVETTYHVTAAEPSVPSFTISVEASTVGLGYLIPPTAMSIEGSHTLDYYLEKILEQHGYKAISEDTYFGYYLSGIEKENITQNVSVPQDLIDHLNTHMPRAYTGNFRKDSLSEFDGSRQSGWMYSVNNVYLQEALSSKSVSDHDVVRVRFTMASGNDIGGGMATGGNNENWEKEW